jgi:two-component system cell cycle response regulator DivK
MSKPILIVEDNALVVEMYRSALRTLDARLLEARDGDGALRLAAAQAPALIIMDIMLPGASGYEVLKDLKKLPALAGAPVLAVTTAATAADAAKIKDAGFDGLIPKPINIPAFVETVRRHLNG